jgi:large subunit ribosomal protein L10
MNKAEKAEFIDAMHERLGKTGGVFLADFTGVTVAQDRQLRRKLTDAGVEMKVVKNTLFLRAVAKTSYEGLLDQLLTGPNAVVIADDVVAAAKVLTQFLKENDSVTLKIKGGALGTTVLSPDDIKKLSTMASREQLIGQFMSLLQTPLRQFAVLLQAPLRDFASVVAQLEKKKADQPQPS